MPSVNKVVYSGRTLIDLTNDTVTAAAMRKGYTAHDRSGAQITGTMEEGAKVYSGMGKPSASLGSNGDIYVKTK